MLHLGFRLVLVGLLLSLVSGCASKKNTSSAKEVVVSAVNVERPVLSENLAADYQEALNFMQQGRYAAAKTSFERLLSIEPRLAGAHTNLGIIFQHNNDSVSARAEFERALALNPRNAGALAALGSMAIKNGEYRKAESLLLEAVDIDASLTVAHYNLGVLYELYLQNKSGAIEHYERYVLLSPDRDTKTVARWIKLLER